VAGAARQPARRLGPDHELAVALWTTGWYEARTLAVLIDDADRVTPRVSTCSIVRRTHGVG
jgi:hypothetical protein